MVYGYFTFVFLKIIESQLPFKPAWFHIKIINVKAICNKCIHHLKVILFAGSYQGLIISSEKSSMRVREGIKNPFYGHVPKGGGGG